MCVSWMKNGRTGVWRTQTGKVMYGSELEDRAESALLRMKQVLEGRLWEEPRRFLDSHDVLSKQVERRQQTRTVQRAPLGFPTKKEPKDNVGEVLQHAI